MRTITQANWLVASLKRVSTTTVTVRHSKNRITHSTASADDEEEELDEDTLLTITILQKRANKTAVSKQPKSFSLHLHVPVELITEY